MVGGSDFDLFRSEPHADFVTIDDYHHYVLSVTNMLQLQEYTTFILRSKLLDLTGLS
jgi:hypothetical protein